MTTLLKVKNNGKYLHKKSLQRKIILLFCTSKMASVKASFKYLEREIKTFDRCLLMN